MRCGALILPAIAVMALALGACDKLSGASSADCTSEDSKAVIQSIASGQIEKAAKTLATGSDGQTIASESKIRATVALIKIAIEDIRTTKSDPNSTKKFCQGTLKVVMPLGMIADADSAHAALSMADMTKLAEGHGMERSADTFSHQIDFSVQPTDDKKKIFGEVEGLSDQFSFLGEVVAAHLIWPTLQARQESASLEAATEEATRTTQLAAQNQADLDMASAENKLAAQTISEIWKSMPEDSRAELLDLQRAWIRKKTADCNIKAAEASTEPLIREAARLRCDTALTNARSDELRAYL